jgi:hypothetical protein
MKRTAAILLFSTSLALANVTPAVKDEPVPPRTMLIAAALILSPLFAGWALARNRSKKPPR